MDDRLYAFGHCFMMAILNFKKRCKFQEIDVGAPIKMLSTAECGHALIVTAEDRVFLIGMNYQGHFVFTLLEFDTSELKGAPITHISAGCAHCVAVANNKIYTVGINSDVSQIVFYSLVLCLLTFS